MDTGIFNPLLYRLSYQANQNKRLKACLFFRVAISSVKGLRLQAFPHEIAIEPR